MRANFRSLKTMEEQGHCPGKVLRRAITGHPTKGPWRGLFSSEATLKQYEPPKPEMLRMSNTDIAEEAIRRIQGLIRPLPQGRSKTKLEQFQDIRERLEQ